MVRLNPGDIVLRMNGKDGLMDSTGWKADVVGAGMFDVLCREKVKASPTHDSWYDRTIGNWIGGLSNALFETYRLAPNEDRGRIFVEFETNVVSIENLEVWQTGEVSLDQAFLAGEFKWGSFVEATVYVRGLPATIAVNKVARPMKWAPCADRHIEHMALSNSMASFLTPAW